eukprot:15210_1
MTMPDQTKDSSGVVVTAVATAVPDIESQQGKQQQQSAAAAAANSVDLETGKGLGMAMFILLIVALICTFFQGIIAFICLIATIIISSAITCGCCCAP